MLLDIFSISEILQDVIRCVTLPGLKLVMVSYLFVVTFIIYATYGLQVRPGEDFIPKLP